MLDATAVRKIEPTILWSVITFAQMTPTPGALIFSVLYRGGTNLAANTWEALSMQGMHWHIVAGYVLINILLFPFQQRM